MLTADYSFLSYYPYYGFQGLTSHYANPLAEFDKRAAAIESLGRLKTADEFTRPSTLPWLAPTVFLMRAAARPARRTPTRCDWPPTSAPTSPTCAATPSTWTPACSPGRISRSRTSDRSCWPSGTVADVGLAANYHQLP